jgi:hypothetical protein
MNRLEFLLALHANLHEAAVGLTILTGLVTAGAILFYFLCAGDYDAARTQPKLAKAARWTGAGFLIFGLLAAVPTVNDLWRVRLSLIAFEAASPENVVKAGAHLETIVEGLECKYLNRCKENK